jgi:hypothetical protein
MGLGSGAVHHPSSADSLSESNPPADTPGSHDPEPLIQFVVNLRPVKGDAVEPALASSSSQ